MAFDFLKSEILEYKGKKGNISQSKKDLSEEISKADGLNDFLKQSDFEVAFAIKDVRKSLDVEQRELEEQEYELIRKKDAISEQINQEQKKLEQVQRKMQRLSGKKYTSGTDRVSKKCEEMLLELDDMLIDMDVEKTDNICGDYAPQSKVVKDGYSYRTDDKGQIHMKKEDGAYQVLPNKTYTANGYTYQTDEKGRIVHAKGNIKVKDGGRESLNTVVPDMQPGDHRGHIIGDLFGGSNRNDNLVAQLGTVNQGAYKSLELKLASLCEKGHSVYCDYSISYNNDTKRPAMITVEYSIDGDIPICQDFLNDRSDE